MTVVGKKTGRFFMMWTKSSLLSECLSSLYFFALKSFGWGSVPQSICTIESVIFATYVRQRI